MTPSELQTRLQDLRAEQALARLEGLGTNGTYMTSLDTEIAIVHCAYVGAAVSDIARFRAELSGPHVG